MSTGNGQETQIPVRCPLIRRPVRLDHGQDCDLGWTQLHVLQRVQAPGPGQGRDAAGGEEDSDGEQRGWHRGDCHHEHPPRGHRQVTAVHLHHHQLWVRGLGCYPPLQAAENEIVMYAYFKKPDHPRKVLVQEFKTKAKGHDHDFFFRAYIK